MQRSRDLDLYSYASATDQHAPHHQRQDISASLYDDDSENDRILAEAREELSLQEERKHKHKHPGKIAEYVKKGAIGVAIGGIIAAIMAGVVEHKQHKEEQEQAASLYERAPPALVTGTEE